MVVGSVSPISVSTYYALIPTVERGYILSSVTEARGLSRLPLISNFVEIR